MFSLRSRGSSVAFGAVLFAALSMGRVAHGDDADPRGAARTAFESGLAHFDRGEWSAALADFLRSRQLFPTKSATKNAAVCFRREGRFDEALETFEALLREFPDLSPQDRAFADKEIAELRSSIGSIEIEGAEPGATIVVDGRDRGTYPPPAPLRVAAGSHVVRVYKQGFVPFERRVDVGGKQTAVVDAKLGALTRAGRLSVTETQGRALDVLVDNVAVGKTPWEGTVSTGVHMVVLRGEGDLGTQPVTASVALGAKQALSLAAEVLGSSLRVTPTPAGATVSIDSVSVGQGVWEGKLREGEHSVEVVADGFLLKRRRVRLARGERVALPMPLERDPSSPMWRAAHPSRPFLEADAGPAVGLSYGGDVRSCADRCNAALPLGLAATLRGGYELSSGLVFGLDAGWLVVSAGVSDRATSVVPRGLAPNLGRADDDLGLRGFRFGPSAGYRTHDESWPITLRLGAGLFVGSAVDARTGRFITSTGAAYEVDVSESQPATYVYIAPEVRVARTIVSRFEVSVGLSMFALVALSRPSWRNDTSVLAAPPGQQGDGVAVFGRETLVGSVVLALVPTAGVRYAF